MKVVIVGQGYVGLPLAMRATEVGHDVVGLDSDPDRVKLLASGETFVEDITNSRLNAALATARYKPTTESCAAAGFDVAVITVPTPLREGLPDLSFIEAAARALGENMTRGCTVILESTTYPGTTQELLAPILSEVSGLAPGADFHLGYSPERIDPGNPTWNVVNTPKLVSGIDAASLDAVKKFYDSIVEHTVPVSGPKEAELTKLLENTFRHVNIALVNELAMFAHDLGIDVWEAIDAASTKPFGFLRFTPGPGVGGHCLPIDPSYLSWRVKRALGLSFRFVELANDVNDHMPDYVVRRLTVALNQKKRALNGSRILVLGLAYKKNTGDARESPSTRVVELLAGLGCDVRVADPHVAGIEIRPAVTQIDLTEAEVVAADAVLLLVDHDAFDYALVERSAQAGSRHATADERRRGGVPVTVARRVVVTTEARFQRRADGSIWHDTGGRAYGFWTRYLDVFEEVVVVARVFRAGASMSAQVEGPGVRVHALPAYSGMRELLRVLPKLRSSIRTVCTQPDTALIARVPGPIGSMAIRERRRSKLPYALEVVGDPYDVLQKGQVRMPMRSVARGLSLHQLRCSCADAVACAYVTREALQRRYPPGPAAYTAAFPGVDLTQEAFASSPRSTFRDAPRVVVSIGTLAPYKGHDVLLRAAGRLNAGGAAVRVRLVGDGPARESLRHLAAELGMTSYVEFVGQKPSGAGVRTELDNADLFVLPSLTEGLPRALLEAMARGLPCVASDVGGVSELLDRDDLVPAGDPVALYTKLQLLLGNPALLSTMAGRNLMRAQEYRREVIVVKRRAFLEQVAAVSLQRRTEVKDQFE